MKHRLLHLLFFICITVQAQKTVFRPTEWNNSGHEYYNRMSDSRMYESENFVLFWGDLVGTNPENYNGDLRFNPRAVADTLEFSFTRMIKDLKFINNAPSTNFGRYKTVVVILGTFSGNDDRTTGFAHASSYSNTIGALFVHPAAVRDGGALSHEYAHTLQMMMRIQENPGQGRAFAGYDWAGPFFEGHANYMRAVTYPKWADTETTLTRWLQTRHFMWSSNRHHYTNYHVLFYIQEKDGFDMTRRLWAESANQEHPFETLRRLKGFNQEQLNDYLWGYAARQVAFDYPVQWNDQINHADNMGRVIRSVYQGIRSRMPRYTSREFTILSKVQGASDRYYVNEDWAPQDYGMNIIPLYPTCEGASKTVGVKFKGHTEVNSEFAGWRYGFVTTKADGTISRYSPMYAQADGEASFTLNTDTESIIYLVVFSAPRRHQNYNMDVGYPKQRRYPYELKIANAVPEGYQPTAQFRSWLKNNGRIHSNGGGWVANSATVASSVYVGPYAIVRSGNISGNVRIEGHAMVENATIRDNVVIKDNACVFGGTYSGSAVIEGNAWLEGGSANSSANIKGNAFLFAGTYGGNVVIGGDAEIGSCSNGVYMQFPYWRNGRENCDGKGAGDVSNTDINPSFAFFQETQMNFSAPVACNGQTYDCANVVNGTATLDACGKCIGGTTGQVSDDTDGDGTIDCEDECPNDPNKIAAGICECGVAESTCVTTRELSYELFMAPMSEYTAISVSLAGVADALGMTVQQVASSFGTSILYYGVYPDGSLNSISTANAPGHWYNQSGQIVAWGENAYVYSELNINTLTANIGQYPGRSQSGNQYTIKQALVHTGTGSVTSVILTFAIHVAEEDCNGEPGGDAYLDLCNQCAGGTTGIVPVTDPQRCVVTALSGTAAYKIQIYPNPSNAEVYISEETDWVLSDVAGLELLRGRETVLALNRFSPGIYLLRIDNRIVKIIKN